MRIGKWLSLGVIPALLCSCSLLPQEEEYVSTPTIRAYTQAEYELSYVQFGDVILNENIPCSFLPVSTQSLSFPVSGILYDEILVQEGDLVEKGQLLGQLDMSGLEESVLKAEEEIASLERSAAYLREQCALETDAQARTLAAMTPEQAASARTPEDVQEDYGARITAVEDSIAISRLRLEEQQAQLAQRQLYADIDGAVTYVRKYDEGTRSVEGELVISIADAGTSVFSGATLNYDLLPEGKLVTINSNKESLPAVVVSAASLGLEETFSEKGAKTLYFQLQAPSMNLESGDRGTLVLTLAESHDTLFITSEALHSVDGRHFVYQMDENGLKTMVDVEIGLVTTRYVEILSGLSEGDNVILD